MKVFSLNLYDYFGLAQPEGAEGELFCYLPDTSREVNPARRHPAILVLPGGGYAFTSDREAEPVALQFLARGYAAFVLRYSVAPACFPTQLREAAMVMAYIRRNAAELTVDPSMVAAIGFSAGGHLCGTLATMYDAPELVDIGDGALIRPDAVCLTYPVTVEHGPTHEGTWQNVSGGDPAVRHRLSLDRLARPDMPPVYIWHTRTDAAVPVCNSLTLAQKLDELGVSFSLHIFARGGHGLSLANDLVYPAGKIPAHSSDIGRWIDETITFFAESGLELKD